MSTIRTDLRFKDLQQFLSEKYEGRISFQAERDLYRLITNFAIRCEGCKQIVHYSFGFDIEREQYTRDEELLAIEGMVETLVHACECWKIAMRVPDKIVHYESPRITCSSNDSTVVFPSHQVIHTRDWKRDAYSRDRGLDGSTSIELSEKQKKQVAIEEAKAKAIREERARRAAEAKRVFGKNRWIKGEL